ncbi:MFS transporter [Streptomyces sp. NPDC051940]|uniref:MFS transporter n=1 Tax=Streptomyces sp. NPDC051940 TaxID=3155675 RepID=UPI003413C007
MPLKTKLGFIACLATVLLAVLDMNIVSAATVPIVRDLDPAHGVAKIPWLISAYSLAATAALPLLGKLSDVYGAKRVFLAVVAFFLAGSALCGAAQDMGQLIAARAVQGIGGGGLMSITMVVIAQLKGPGEEGGGGRGASVGGLVAGAGMAVGPWLGGLLADHADWRWIFYVNLPVGLAVLAVGAYALQLPGRTRAHRIDYPGAALAAAFASTLLLVTEWGGKDYAWGSPVVLGLVALALALLAAFLWRQSTAAEPILPLTLFRDRTLRAAFAIQGLIGMALMGGMVYVMIYLQVARGIAADAAALYLLPMAAGMTAVGLLAGRLGWSNRTFAISGTAVSALALGWLATSGTDTSLWAIRGALLLLGMGFGQLIGQLIVLVQQVAPPAQLGVATTAIRFFQTLGGALGAALFGTLLARVYASSVPGGTTDDIASLHGPAFVRAVDAFVTSTDAVFAAAAGLMALALVAALRLPHDADEGHGERAQDRVAAAA